jgi:type I restriction enzyme M protein
VERDDSNLKTDSKNSLGSTLTFFSINQEVAKNLDDLLTGRVRPGPSVNEEQAGEEFRQVKEDYAANSVELIKDKVLQLDDAEMQELLAALLRAMGYKARVAPKGPDRGVDVIASTQKTDPLQREDLDEFVACYRPGKRHLRKPTWSEETPEGRWRSFEYDDLTKRDKVNLDIFWLKDQSLEDSDDLPPPDVLAQEIADDLQTALEQFTAISEKVKA